MKKYLAVKLVLIQKQCLEYQLSALLPLSWMVTAVGCLDPGIQGDRYAMHRPLRGPFCATSAHVRGQSDTRRHLHSLENNESRLVLDQLTFPSLAQLDYTVNASDENADYSQGEEGSKQQQLGLRHWQSRGVLFNPSYPPHIFRGEQDEKRHACNLEAQTGNHDIRPHHRIFTILTRHAGQPPTCSLQDQADDVAGYEDGCIAARLDSARPERNGPDDIAEGEVDSRREKGGRKGQAADLDQESVPVEGVGVRYQAAGVSDDFGDAS
jgi:hypothetical protein